MCHKDKPKTWRLTSQWLPVCFLEGEALQSNRAERLQNGGADIDGIAGAKGLVL